LTHPLKLALAALFQKKGQTLLKLEECKLIWCFDLHYCEPAQVDGVVEVAIAAGYLKERPHGLELTFPVDDIDIPAGFKPGLKELLDAPPVKRPEPAEPVFPGILAELHSGTGLSRREIISHINHSQKEHRLTDIEVEALLLGARRGVELDRFNEPVARLLQERYTRDTGHTRNTD